MIRRSILWRIAGRSIRWRIAIWYASALTAALLLFGVLIRVSVERKLISGIDADLADRAARFQSYFLEQSDKKDADRVKDELEEFCAVLPPGSSIELSVAAAKASSDGRRILFRHPVQGGQTGPVRRLRRDFTGPSGAEYQITAATDLRPVNHTTELLGWQLLAMAPLVIAIASAGGWLLSRRALKPVDDMAHAAQAISIENLSVRLEAPRTGDELERFATVFNTMLGRLESAVNTLSQFVADASHELRTPLAVIRTSAEIALRRARSPEAYRDALVGIAAESEQMTALVEDLLFLARSDAGVAALPGAAIELAVVVSEAIRAVDHLAEAKSIRIATDLESRALVMATPGALKRMFVALLDNAIKNSPPGSDVRVHTNTREHGVEITIRDFGCGIDPADLPHIFQRFYRADKSRTGQGYGLGLAIADSIARAHGANIEVSSAAGAGSTFTVHMPAIARDSSAITRAAQTPA